MSLPIEERWLPVVGYEGYYEVSDLGNVRSLPRTIRISDGFRRLRGRVLRPGINPKTGRRVVVLRGGGPRQTHTIYPLVLEAFVGPRPPGMEACHNNGDHTDDRLINLRWGTSSANTYDSVRHGTHNNARKTHCKRGHLLAEPNLVLSVLAEGRRSCLACHKSRQPLLRLQAKGPIDRVALADAHYRRIMKE